MKRKPQRIAFTIARLKALKPQAERYWVLDTNTPGLSVAVQPTGRKSYYFTRKVNGRVERVKVGPVGMPESDLKRVIGKLQGAIADGKSPTQERRRVRREMTLGELWTLFKVRRGEAKRSFTADKQRYEAHLEAWAKRKLSTITRPAVAELLARIAASGGPVTANRTRSLLSVMFSTGIAAGLDIQNPVQGTTHNKEVSRDRYLEPDELRRFWRALLAEPEDDTRVYFQLALLTAVRSATLTAARWADIDLRDAVWHIPAEYMKAAKPLDLPLADRTVEILRTRFSAAAPGATFVFPSADRSSGYIATPREGWTRVIERAGITGVKPHDLRRTHATYGLAAGIPIEVLGKALGHTVIGGVTAIYARADIQLVRLAVERTVDAILRVAEAPETEDASKVLAFPRPAWANGAVTS
jgi:integrase